MMKLSVFLTVLMWLMEEAEVEPGYIKKVQQLLKDMPVEDKDLNEINELFEQIFTGLQWDDKAENGYEIIEYNQDYYELWKKGVKQKLSVEMTYTSASSGVTTRLVDPYLSKAPYGEGFCHLRQEVRQFRFDRIKELRLTNKYFTKKK